MTGVQTCALPIYKFATLTELQLKRESAMQDRFDQTVSTVENNIVYHVTKTSNYLMSYINQFVDRIEQIIKEESVLISDFETYKTSISTMFEQTKDSFNYTFKTLEESIKNVDGTISTNQNEMVKYIRFEDGNIILGLVGNEILLKESHNRLSFMQNNIEVAYFSNNKLFVTSAEFLDGIKVINLELKKESNGSVTLG